MGRYFIRVDNSILLLRFDFMTPISANILSFCSMLSVLGWSWESDDRPMFSQLCADLESIHSSSVFDEAMEPDLLIHRIRMPTVPQTLLTPKSRRSFSCEQMENAGRKFHITPGSHKR